MLIYNADSYLLLELEILNNDQEYTTNIPIQNVPKAKRSQEYLLTLPIQYSSTVDISEPVYVKVNKDKSESIHYEVKRMVHKQPYEIKWYGKTLFLIKDDDVVHLVDKIDKV